MEAQVLEEPFSSQARAILRLFLLSRDDRFCVREVAALTNQPRRAVQLIQL